jgi:RNA polymerase sigma-70 factor (ECF subfamily)
MDREAQWSAWMRAANAGDGAAYRQLLANLTPVLRAISARGLARAGRSPSDAEDIVQEILIAIHTKRHTWDEAQPLGPWVRAIARYKVMDALRRRWGSRDVCIDDLADELATPATRSDLPDIRRLAQRLTSRQRDVVLAVALEGRSTPEVATTLGMKEGTVRVTLHRGLAALAALVRAKD